MTRINPANITIVAIVALNVLLGFVSPKIMVLYPEELKNNVGKGEDVGVIKHLYANFGFVPYG